MLLSRKNECTLLLYQGYCPFANKPISCFTINITVDIWHLCLLNGASAFQFIIVLTTRLKTKDTTNNPLFGSKSPSDFWGRRWNNVVHKVLKVSLKVHVCLVSIGG